MVLYWVWFVAFLVAAVVVDRFVSFAPPTRQAFRIVVLVVASLWVLRLVGILARVIP